MANGLPSTEERLEFLEGRRDGVGGSDVAAICNLNPYRTPLDVYLEKVREPTVEDAESIHLIRGQLLEDVFAELYAERTGRDIRRMGQRVHPEYEFARVNVDRQILDPGDGKGTGALEIKSPGRESYRKLIEAGLPERYIVQVQWEMFVPGYDWASFAAGNLEDRNGPLVHFDVERNDLLIEQLLERVHTFWHEHVVERKPPHPSEWEPDAVEVPDTSGERVVVEDPDIQREIARLMDAYDERNRAKDAYEERKERVQAVLEDAGIEKLQVPGQGKVNYGWRSGRTYFKDDRLREYGVLDPEAMARWINERLSKASNVVLNGPVDAEELLDACEVDYSLFEKQGDAYRSFRPYPEDDRRSIESDIEEGDDE